MNEGRRRRSLQRPASGANCSAAIDAEFTKLGAGRLSGFPVRRFIQNHSGSEPFLGIRAQKIFLHTAEPIAIRTCKGCGPAQKYRQQAVML